MRPGNARRVELKIDNAVDVVRMVLEGVDFTYAVVEGSSMRRNDLPMDVAKRQQRIDAVRKVLDEKQRVVDEYRRVRQEDPLYDVKDAMLKKIKAITAMGELDKIIAEESRDWADWNAEKHIEPLSAKTKALLDTFDIPKWIPFVTSQPYDESRMSVYIDLVEKLITWLHEFAVPAIQQRRVELVEAEKKAAEDDDAFYANFDVHIAKEDVRVPVGSRNVLAVAQRIWDTFEIHSPEWNDFLRFMKRFTNTVEFTAPECKASCWRALAAYMTEHHGDNESLMLILNTKL